MNLCYDCALQFDKVLSIRRSASNTRSIRTLDKANLSRFALAKIPPPSVAALSSAAARTKERAGKYPFTRNSRRRLASSLLLCLSRRGGPWRLVEKGRHVGSSKHHSHEHKSLTINPWLKQDRSGFREYTSHSPTAHGSLSIAFILWVWPIKLVGCHRRNKSANLLLESPSDRKTPLPVPHK